MLFVRSPCTWIRGGKASRSSSVEWCYRTTRPPFCSARKDKPSARPSYICVKGDTSRLSHMKCLLAVEIRYHHYPAP